MKDFSFTLSSDPKDTSPTLLKKRIEISNELCWLNPGKVIPDSQNKINAILSLPDCNIVYVWSGRQSKVFKVLLGDLHYTVKIHQHSDIALSWEFEYRDSYVREFEMMTALSSAISTQLKEKFDLRISDVYFASPYCLMQEFVEWVELDMTSWKLIKTDSSNFINSAIVNLYQTNPVLWKNIGFDGYPRNIIKASIPNTPHVIIDPFFKSRD